MYFAWRKLQTPARTLSVYLCTKKKHCSHTRQTARPPHSHYLTSVPALQVAQTNARHRDERSERPGDRRRHDRRHRRLHVPGAGRRQESGPARFFLDVQHSPRGHNRFLKTVVLLVEIPQFNQRHSEPLLAASPFIIRDRVARGDSVSRLPSTTKLLAMIAGAHPPAAAV